jgi:hypothetical protein
MFRSRIWKLLLGLPFSFGLFAETPPPVMPTSLPHGYAQTVVSSYSQTCTSNFPTGPSTCNLTGDPKLINRGGTSLDRAGNTYFIDNYVDQEFFDEHGGLESATAVPFATIRSATTSCTITGSEGLKVSQALSTFSFNAPLNVLNLVTTNVRVSFHNIVPFLGSTPAFLGCTAGDLGYGFMNISSMMLASDVTNALIRVTGPFPQGKHNNGQGNQGDNGQGNH